MPELPEVETIRRQLEPLLVDATFTACDAHGSDKFQPALDATGASIISVTRRGKYLIFDLHDDRELVAHLGMTGSFHVVDDPLDNEPLCAAYGPHARAVWALDDDRHLVFRDTRRFGRLRVVNQGDYSTIPTLNAMGPEPLGDEFSGASLHRAVMGSSRAIKTQLLSQRPVAGVGNIYADEALFLAKIDPRSRRVGRKRCDDLAEAIIDVLRTGVENGGTTLRDYVNAEGGSGQNQHALVAYGRVGEPCVVCADPLSSIVLDARTTTFCRRCQRR